VKIKIRRVSVSKLNLFLKSHILTSSIFFSLIVFAALLISILVLNLNSQSRKNSQNLNKLNQVQLKLNKLQNENQYKINQSLKKNIDNIQTSYRTSVDLYQRILDLKAQNQDTKELDKEFAQSLEYLYNLNYASASATLKALTQDVEKDEAALIVPTSSPNSSQNVAASNTPPASGFSVQSVSTDNGNFTVEIVAADLNSTRVIVDTASDSDCSNNCPTLPLSDYVSRSGAFAGINGSYFCPAEYPSCAGKTGSFDTLLMNKNKVYFNSSNNVYSSNPAVIFYGNTSRFVGQALEWGRDSGVDMVLSNYPLLVSGGNIVYSGGGDPKFTPKGPRDFIAVKGSMVYIGVILNASMEDSAHVLKALGMDNALNLDEGGSTALWDGGYKAGPGRNIPNAILFVRK